MRQLNAWLSAVVWQSCKVPTARSTAGILLPGLFTGLWLSGGLAGIQQYMFAVTDSVGELEERMKTEQRNAVAQEGAA